MALQITSTAFAEGDPIPAKHTCDGADVSPPLSWEDVPDATVSFALICDDPDAPVGTWVHWVIYGIPAGSREIPSSALTPGGAKQGINDFKRIGYGGPCPPPGPAHRYFFKLYALDRGLELDEGATKGDLLAAMEGHILAEAQLMGTYQRA